MEIGWCLHNIGYIDATLIYIGYTDASVPIHNKGYMDKNLPYYWLQRRPPNCQ